MDNRKSTGPYPEQRKLRSPPLPWHTSNKTMPTPTKPHFPIVSLPMRLWEPVTFKLQQRDSPASTSLLPQLWNYRCATTPGVYSSGLLDSALQACIVGTSSLAYFWNPLFSRGFHQRFRAGCAVEHALFFPDRQTSTSLGCQSEKTLLWFLLELPSSPLELLQLP